MSGTIEELRQAEREAAINKLLKNADERAPWYEDLRVLAGAFADELEKLQRRPEEGSRFVVVYDQD